MKIISIIVAVTILGFASHLSSSSAGIAFTAVFDLVSFLIVVVPSYLYTSTKFNSLNFFNNQDAIKDFGNSAMGFAYIGTVLGFVYMLAGMSKPVPPGVNSAELLASSLAVAILTILYGLIIKYLVCGAFIKDN